jgi:hypothetical protein
VGLELVDATNFRAGARAVGKLPPLRCPAPRLARLLNGHVAVVDFDFVYELDDDWKLVGKPAPLSTPRCDPAVTSLPDGTLAIIGGSSQLSEEASIAFQIYDPRNPQQGAASERSLDTPVVGGRALVRFSELWLMGQDTQSVIDWTTGKEDLAMKGPWLSLQSATSLADGSIVRAAHGSDIKSAASKRLVLAPTDASELELGVPPLQVSPGDKIELTGLRLSNTWPENSGGTTNGSATNAPIALWMPVLDGWPVTGTFISWSDTSATWRVPHPAFPGLGSFGYVLSGTWHPLRLVEIKELEMAGACVSGSECASGSCADGVCCDRACTGACEACTMALKGGQGPDGSCGPTPADAPTPDPACGDTAACGRTGFCDGEGQCATVPDGQACDVGARCQSGRCEPTSACGSTADCAEGLVCNAEHLCHAPLSVPLTSVGCAPGCRVGHSEPSAPELTALGISLALAGARRRRGRMKLEQRRIR